MRFPTKKGDLEDIDHRLVVLTILRNTKVNGKDDIPYIMEKNMFETTNQLLYYFQILTANGLLQ